MTTNSDFEHGRQHQHRRSNSLPAVLTSPEILAQTEAVTQPISQSSSHTALSSSQHRPLYTRNRNSTFLGLDGDTFWTRLSSTFEHHSGEPGSVRRMFGAVIQSQIQAGPDLEDIQTEVGRLPKLLEIRFQIDVIICWCRLWASYLSLARPSYGSWQHHGQPTSSPSLLPPL